MDLSLIFRSSMQINFGRLQRVRLTTSSSIPSKDMFRSHDVVARRRAYAERYAKERVASLRSVYEWNDRCTCIGQEAQHFRFFFLTSQRKESYSQLCEAFHPLIKASSELRPLPHSSHDLQTQRSRASNYCACNGLQPSGASYDHPSL